jgi:hypothetical protein
MNGIPEKQKSEFAHPVNPPIGIGQRCTKCHETKAPNEFNRDAQKRTGLSSRCRDCLKENATIRRSLYGKEINAGQRKWQKEHPESVKEWARKWREKNLDKWNNYSKQWRERNPEKYRQQRERE